MVAALQVCSSVCSCGHQAHHRVKARQQPKLTKPLGSASHCQAKGRGAPGTFDTWELCYSRHKHGWSSHQFNVRCRSKGNLFFIQRRGGGSYKGRVFGGYSGHNWRNGHSGYSDEARGRSFLFRCPPLHTHTRGAKDHFLFVAANLFERYPFQRRTLGCPTFPSVFAPARCRVHPSNADVVEYAENYRGRDTYPGNTNYMMCFGNGHDICTRNDGYSWSHFGTAWRAAKSKSTSHSWMQGDYDHNAKNENDLYEVYITK